MRARRLVTCLMAAALAANVVAILMVLLGVPLAAFPCALVGFAFGVVAEVVDGCRD